MMCGRFSIAVRIGLIADRFGVLEPPGLVLPLYNIAPSEYVPVIVSSGKEYENRALMMRWGLIPSWTRDRAGSPAPINARAEGLIGKPMYRNLLANGRCIVPATGYYEWKSDGRKKLPSYLSMKNRALFAMAGLFDTWKSPDGSEIMSFAIITTEPNELAAPLHNRMPAILTCEGEREWLSTGNEVTGSLHTLLVPCSSGEMQVYEVTTAMNNPAYKGEKSVQKFIRGGITNFHGPEST